MSDYVEDVSILFCDIKGFTTISAELNPSEVVTMLHDLFTGFDVLSDEYKVRS